jgi:magnesium transporter
MKREISRFRLPSGNDQLRRALSRIHPYDLALLYLDQGEGFRTRMISLLDSSLIARMFVELSQDSRHSLLEQLPDETRTRVFDHIPSDELSEFMDGLEAEEQDAFFLSMSRKKSKVIRLLLAYPDDTAASVMSADFLTIGLRMTIKEATKAIISQSKEGDHLDKVFVTDEDGHLMGEISLVGIITARPEDRLEAIMTPVRRTVRADQSIEDTIDMVMDYDESVIPVISGDNRILGIVTADDVFDELIEDAESDFQGIASIRDHDNSLSAFERSKRRLPWLMTAVVMNLIIVLLLSVFEATLVEVVALVLFQPMILGMSGNIGTQALAVTILGLHNDRIKARHVMREMMIGAFNSALMALFAFAYVFGFLTLFPTGNEHPAALAAVVALAVFVSMSVSAMIGAAIPLLLDRYGADPASASGPIMTTANDLIGLVIYFSFATLVFL